VPGTLTASYDSDGQCPASEACSNIHSHQPTVRFQDLSLLNQNKVYQKYSTEAYDYLLLPVWEDSSLGTSSAHMARFQHP
jgi:hypothetical protein